MATLSQRALKPPAGPRRVAARLADTARSVGWPRAVVLAPLWAVARRYLLLEAPLDPLPAEEAAAAARAIVEGSGLRLTWLERGELASLAEIDPLASPAEAARRLDEGHVCSLWWREDRPVHYRWVAGGPMRLPLAGLVFEPGPGDYVSMEVCTHRELRGGGVHSATVAWSTAHALSLGRTRKLAFVAWWNAPSLTVAERRGGFRRVGSVTAWGPGRLGRATGGGRARVEGRVVTVR